MRRTSAGGVVLICEECGEKIILGGPLSVWWSEPTGFECGCGEELTLADRVEELPEEGAPAAVASKASRLRI